MKGIKIGFSSRPIAGLFFLFGVYLFLFSGDLLKLVVKVDSLENIIFAVKFSFILPFIFWSIYEIFRLVKRLKQKRFYMFLSFLIIVAPMAFYIWKKSFSSPSSSLYIECLSVVFFALIAMMFFSTFIYGRTNILYFDEVCQKYSFRRLLAIAIVFWNSLFFMSFAVDDSFWIKTLITLVIFTDTLAYFFGKLMGINRVFRYSPRKTLEGFVVSCIIVPAVTCLGFWLFDGKQHHLAWVYAISFFIAFFSNLGDLFFSFNKRIFKIKDFGRLFGNHGGFWDRFDSHSFALAFGILAIFVKSLI